MRAFTFVALLAFGCTETAQQRGEALFNASSFSVSPSNPDACSTCHSTKAGGDPPALLAGFTLFDAAARPTWWGGAYDTFLDAVNECYVEFMRGDRILPDDPDGRALFVYLTSIAPDAQSPALPLTVVKNLGTICMGSDDTTTCGPTQKCTQLPDLTFFCDIPNGDVGRGADLYQRGCVHCHGALHTGAGRLGTADSVIPDESLKAHGGDPRLGARGITVEKLRHGKFFTVGGNMPFYPLETMTDAQIGDILAYMGL